MVFAMEFLKARKWWGIEVDNIRDTLILSIPVNTHDMCLKLQRRTLAEIIQVIHAVQHRNASNIALVVLRGLENIQFSNNIDDVLKLLVKILLRAVKATNCVLVAMVKGVCSDVGFIITLVCDVIYCSHDSIFCISTDNLMALDYNDFLPSLLLKLGYSWTLNLLLLHRSITAIQAYQLGFVVELFSFGDIMESSIWTKIKKQTLLQGDRIKLLKVFTRQLQISINLPQSLEKDLKKYHSLRDLPGFQHKFYSNRNNQAKQSDHHMIWKSKI